jgi:hypothetical protein
MPPAETQPLGRVNAFGELTLSSKGSLNMYINIDQWNFTGPFSSTASVRNQSGTYVVLTRKPGTPDFSVVDVGESGDLRSRLENHDRDDCWRRNNAGELKVAVLYCDQQSRMAVEAHLRRRFNPRCGDR